MPSSTSDPRAGAEADAAARALKSRAAEIGFDACRIVSLSEQALPPDWPAAARLEAFVEAGHHGDMDWMAGTLQRRRHPRAMWEGARSAIMLGLNYGPAGNPLADLAHSSHGNISVYARGGDYHDIIKKRLNQLARALAEALGAEVKVFVDTAPLMEKPLAEASGLGWQGKHTNLVSRDHGSWLFLGAILTAAHLTPDRGEADHCGTCRACLDICPTNAFPAPYRLDARRCISYLTIEHKGPIPHEFRAAMGNRIYGCDDCLAVCPWNKFAATASESLVHARAETTLPHLCDLLALSDADFREIFAGSPIKRIGHARFIRNVLIAAGNSADPALTAPVRNRLGDPEPLVRGAAVWALARLDDAVFRSEKAARSEQETDSDVLDEWRQAEDCTP